ncbi:cAMP-dependent protein kinase catalytic subunit 3 isoform X2 [Parasteatoda tepidariorum]|uniref:cAMP-dependent protein kinase catalytic subunit 3 isoform X2 n=1 Tax=Parasteatoda tepidariorum TaxID=114398 RepID=UPI001C724959|nr:cAMP-dependent protein kinase catalytic subunit 3-like isoform X2 [Parasteatoda tepidariorum]
MASSKITREKLKRSGSFQNKEPPPPPTGDENQMPDLKLEDFELLKTIGTGSFGRVVLCRRKKNNKYFAMKILEIADVIQLKQSEHVKNEKSLLVQVQHPFIIELLWTHHDETCLYMLFEYACGGELFTYLRNAGRFSCTTSMFYAAEIVLALDYLHKLCIAYRDLKPENLLLDRDGHLKITDFGFAKRLTDKTWTLCGTPEYLAPEIIQSKGHNKAVDWWALGILIYEMLSGFPPFFDTNPFAIYEKILAGKIDWPKHIDPIAKDLIKKLLVPDRAKRLGNMKHGSEDVKRHRWFKNISWEDVYYKKVQTPLIPKVSHPGDTRYFDTYQEKKTITSSPIKDRDLNLFKDF